MRKSYLRMILVFLLFGSVSKGTAQRLSTGDIAFTGYTTILRTEGISNSTIISFTDNGWDAALCCGPKSSRLIPAGIYRPVIFSPVKCPG
ncbi:hypothetical protein LL912_09260 [Niabella sp. CC-SYL272]|uniref:hypothetical protein n=1 Tax=Niabella agricola TaxID=2891571 RepID=UPI001F3F9104|nr:hypothetical protein [Niabella agricola]MCF3108964.1 hypothetical protein [Niabella agricola]